VRKAERVIVLEGKHKGKCGTKSPWQLNLQTTSMGVFNAVVLDEDKTEVVWIRYQAMEVIKEQA